jgi:hypothetical protein
MTIKPFRQSSPEQSQPDRKVSVPWVFSLWPDAADQHAVGEMASRELVDTASRLVILRRSPSIVTKAGSFSASASSACSFFLLRPPGLPDWRPS